MDALSAAPVIKGEGTAERDWQRWMMSAPIPAQALDRWLLREQRLLVVAPHPDDEVLACGGLISLHFARGGEVVVIAVSDGEASHAGAPGWNAAQLAEARRLESAEGLRRLGARGAKVLRCALPDGQIGAHADELDTMLARILVASDVVVSTWRHDGHPDHEAVGIATASACLAKGCRLLEAPVWMWHWAAPSDPRVPWHRLAGLMLEPATVQRKRKALSAHLSQLRTRDAQRGPVLGAEILARAARTTEYFFV